MKMISFDNVQEYDVIRFYPCSSCGSIEKQYVGTVIRDRNNCLIVVHNDIETMLKREGCFPYMELSWIKDNSLEDDDNIELVYRL